MPERLCAMVITRLFSPGVPQDVALALLFFIRPWNSRFYLDHFQEISVGRGRGKEKRGDF